MAAGAAYAAFMIGKALMDHQAKTSAAAAQRAWKYKKDLATVRKLKIQYGFARQSIADTDRMRVANLDLKAGGSMTTAIDMLKAQASVKASGLPQGQSTDGLLRQAQNTVLKGEAKFLKAMEMKELQLDYRNREINQGMEMAFLNAQAEIAGTPYQQGPGAMGLIMGIGEGVAEGYAYGKKYGGSGGSKGLSSTGSSTARFQAS